MDAIVFNKWVNVVFSGYLGFVVYMFFASILIYQAWAGDKKCVQKTIWAAFSVAMGIVFLWDAVATPPSFVIRPWFRMVNALFIGSAIFYRSDIVQDMVADLRKALARRIRRVREPSR